MGPPESIPFVVRKWVPLVIRVSINVPVLDLFLFSAQLSPGFATAPQRVIISELGSSDVFSDGQTADPRRKQGRERREKRTKIK